MSEDRAIRLLNFQRLCTARGLGAKELQTALGGAASQWYDLLNGRKPSFGEKLARRIEGALHLPRGWLDTTGDPIPVEQPPEFPDAVRSFTPDQIEVAMLFAELEPVDQQELLRDLSAQVERTKRITESVLARHGVTGHAPAGKVAHIAAKAFNEPKGRSLIGGGTRALADRTAGVKRPAAKKAGAK